MKNRKNRRKRDAGGAWNADIRLAFTQPFGGRFERMLFDWKGSGIFGVLGSAS
jgi:hypothetical protein